MKDFVLYIARALAEHPQELSVTEIRGRQTSILELRSSPKDLGRLIGRSGKTIGALRTLLSNLAARQNRRAILEVAE
jgi:predicted RNA-binding protein YlqC (UPF0109 family)